MTGDTCPRCGEPWRAHDVDQYTGERVLCPVRRERKTTPPQEHHRAPRADY